MTSLRFSTSAIRSAASLLMMLPGLTACERSKSAAPAEQSAPKPGVAGEIPESSAEAFGRYLASHLPAGKKFGDFLTNKRDYPTGDTADVYRAVLDTLYLTKDGSPGEVVIDDVAQTRAVTCAQMPCPLLPLHQKEVGLQTMDSYRAATLTRRHIRPFKYRLPLRLMSEDDRRALEVDGRMIVGRAEPGAQIPQEHPFYIGFAAKYPRSWGFATLSTVGMDSAHKKALVEVTHHCGGSCYTTEAMLLWKVGARWHVIERMPEGDPGFNANVPSLHFRSIRGIKSQEEVWAEERAARRADSIKQDQLPREIYGVLTMNPGGGAIRDFVVSLHYGDDYNIQRARVSADSVGLYRFDRPPVGEVGLVVHCPRNSARPDGPAAIGSAVIEPGRKINYNMAFDPRSCDDSLGTPQGIQGYFEAPQMGSAFDTAVWRAATYPGEEEAGVYKRIFQGIGGPYGDGIALVYYKTRSPCSDARCEAEYEKRIRYIPELFISTMENFRSLRTQQKVLRPDILPNASYRMVGDSTMAALERAMGHSNMIYDWGHVRIAWPSVQMVISFGPVAFSPHHRQAMVEVTKSSVDGVDKKIWVLAKDPSGGWAMETTF